MQQYYRLKTEHPDAILLFRVGDFYETFGQDAVRASAILGITLTKRANGAASHVELAGFPYHSLDSYLPRLVNAGQRVAICEQLEDPKKTKTLVKRGITELVTPGTTINQKSLASQSNNFLCAFYPSGDLFGLALLDLSTGEFSVTEGDWQLVGRIMGALKPTEIVYPKSAHAFIEDNFQDQYYTFSLEDWLFEEEFSRRKLGTHFSVHSLKGFGIDHMPLAVAAAGAALQYLELNKHSQLQHIAGISRIDADQHMWLDGFTIRNLELTAPIHSAGKSLFDVLNYTRTPMGARLLKRWLTMPLRDSVSVQARLKFTEALVEERQALDEIVDLLAPIGDLERLAARISIRKANLRDILNLARSLEYIEQICGLLTKSGRLAKIPACSALQPCRHLIDQINLLLEEDSNASRINIRKGSHPDLDQWRHKAYNAKDFLLQIQKREVENTGISSLKISYNNVFGYYLEVTNTHKDKVPDSWTRKQTLVNAERYITPELKQYEEDILQAEERIAELEQQLFEELLQYINEHLAVLQSNAQHLAVLDCHCSFAVAAHTNRYTLPAITNGLELEIKQGRHPVIEKSLPPGEQYIPNDVSLHNDTQQIIVLTGPNMAGKSAILRQTALIALMAQCGSYVPADAATLGIIDKIFTRVGASDNLSVGESTFMVEMTETASILHNLSERSLLVLDEIGRGTSTYDGVSIAWAITEYLHGHPARPKTLFATHYHELNEIKLPESRIAQFHIKVKEVNGKIIFLRTLIPGGTEHSFGIDVAQMAGVPQEVILRAREILKELEGSRGKDSLKVGPPQPTLQLRLFDSDDKVGKRLKEELEKIDVNATSPIEALLKLAWMKDLVKKFE